MSRIQPGNQRRNLPKRLHYPVCPRDQTTRCSPHHEREPHLHRESLYQPVGPHVTDNGAERDLVGVVPG